MALPAHALRKLQPFLKGEVLSLGYPDLLATSKEIEEIFGFKPTRFTQAQEWHGAAEPLPETLELFEFLGVRLTVVDFTHERGVEKIADLNHPQELGKFDLVIDPGTLEHCFNIGQAFINAANAVKVGGVICHLSPMTMLNHGFYNLNPTLFNDFYTQNEWQMLELKVLPSRSPMPHSTARFDMHTEHLLRVFAQRTSGSSLKYPIQTKYLEKMAAKEKK